MHRLAALSLAAALLLPSTGRAQSEEESWLGGVRRSADIAFDVLLLRPSEAIVTATGVVLFLPAAALSAPSGPELGEEAWERFVLRPAEQLLERPLGEF